MTDAKKRPLRKIVFRMPWPVVVNGLITMYMHEWLECGHVQPKRVGPLGAYKAKTHRRCDACGALASHAR